MSNMENILCPECYNKYKERKEHIIIENLCKDCEKKVSNIIFSIL